MARVKLPKKQDYITLRTWLLEHRQYSTINLARLSGISVAKIQEWMVYCDVVNINDKLFKVWVNYKNYSTSEACVVLGVSVLAFNRALKKHGVKKYKTRSEQPKVDPIQLPRNKEEFEELYKKYGVAKIAKMTGLSRAIIVKMKHKYGLTSPRTKFVGSGHSGCNDAKWLREHYINQKMSMKKCAQLANVAPNTIRNWLINHGIVPRSRNATLQAGIP